MRQGGTLRSFYRGEKRYELSNHLGNVLAVITDRRIQSCGAGDVMHYTAQVVSVSDYYPFGMGIKEREWSAPITTGVITHVPHDPTGNRTEQLANGTIKTLRAGWASGGNSQESYTGDCVVEVTDLKENSIIGLSYADYNGHITQISYAIYAQANINTGPRYRYLAGDGIWKSPPVYIPLITGDRAVVERKNGIITMYIVRAAGGRMEIGSWTESTPNASMKAAYTAYVAGTVIDIKFAEITDKQGYSYRYGFNGMEQDDETYGAGNAYDFGARIYDCRLGRWLSRDPLASIQPSWSPYKAFLDNPIVFIDPYGETEKIQTIYINQETGEEKIVISYAQNLMTDGKVHQVDYTYGDGWYNANAYYDYTTTKVVVINSKGEIVDESIQSQEINYKNGVKDYDGIYFGGDDAGDTKFDWSFNEVQGGLVFYSQKGQGQETKKTTGAVNMVDIDPILDAISAFAPGGGLQGKLDDIYKKIELGKDAEALKDAMSIMAQIMETYGEAFDKGYSLKEAIDNASSGTSTQEESTSTYCRYCQDNFETDGDGNVSFDRTDEPATDTTDSH